MGFVLSGASFSPSSPISTSTSLVYDPNFKLLLPPSTAQYDRRTRKQVDENNGPE